MVNLSRLSCFLWFLASATAVHADEPLRWKFQPGQRLSYGIVQEMVISGGDPAGELDNNSRQQLDVTWEIERVDAEGTAALRLKFDRIRTKMTLPIGGLEYDSAAKGPATGMAAINAPLYQALIKAPVELTISADGRVTSVKLPDDVQAALKRMPTSAAFGDLTKPETFQNLFMPGFPMLSPEKSPTPGYQWPIKSTTTLPGAAGDQTVDTNYLYEGVRNVDGKSVAVIRQTRSISFSGSQTVQRTVKEQSTEGEILFDVAAGRLQSTILKHIVTMSVKRGDAVAEQKIEQKVEVKPITPSP